MPLAEGVSARIAYKFYTDPTITPGIPAISATDPAPTGGAILRRVASTLAFTKDTYQSAEIRSDRQVSDFRHGVRRVAGNISGELSPLTYQELFAASMRAHWVPAVTASQVDFTGVTPNSTTSTFTFASGTPITKGFRVGMGIKFTGFTTTTANNNVTYVITSLGGTSGRTVGVIPAPTTGASETTYAMTSTGSTLSVPSTGHVPRKVAIEIWNQDVDVARLYTECRTGGYTINMPATGMSTIEFSFTGRDMELYQAATAPFFSGPTASTTTGLMAAVNGQLRVGGVTIAVITALSIQHALALTAEPVVGSNIVPEIFSGRSIVTGQMTAFFQDVTLLNAFKNETEIDIVAYLTTTSAANSPAMSFYLPRVKLGGADLATTGEGGQMLTIPYQALKYETIPTATSGIENTTIQIWDSEVVTGLLREGREGEPEESSTAEEERSVASAA